MKMREIFLNNRSVEDEKLANFEAKQFDHVKDKVVHNLDFESIVQGVDRQVVWSIVDDIAKKSGVDPKDLNRQAFDNVFDMKNIIGDSSGKAMGFFYTGSNKIFLDSSEIASVAERFGVDPQKIVVESLLHELMHSISRHRLHILQDADMRRMEFKEDHFFSGAYRVSKDTLTSNFAGKILKTDSASMFVVLDEGIVEKISGEIFDEYMRRTGSASEDELVQYREKFSRNSDRNYAKLVQGIDRLCALIGERTGTDPNIVWNSLVRGLFYFDTINKNDEVVKWFAESFGEDFLTNLGKAKTADEFLQLINSVKV